MHEYELMFSLGESDLRKKILGCGDGPASFNAEMTQRGLSVVSCDPIYVFSPAQILDQFKAGIEPVMSQVRAHLQNYVWSYLKPDLVIIDDIGLKALPKHSGEYLPEVIMRRYENRSTIMTSNRPLEEWGKLLSDVPTAGAILDRFLHHAQVIAITGKSYRIKEAPAVGRENKK
jgi:hypothetical protein